MQSLIGIIEAFGLPTVIIISVVVIGLLITIIAKAQKWHKAAEEQRQTYINQGATTEREKQELEKRLVDGDNHMTNLDNNVIALGERVEGVEEAIGILLESDKLDIKAYITEQYQYWIPKKYIDKNVMELLEARFAVYEREGGNGFAARMMSELRQLPMIEPKE